MNIISPAKALMCAVALLSPHRPLHLVGATKTRYDIYRTDRTEHCFEEVIKIGRTFWSDETLWLREVEMEKCND